MTTLEVIRQKLAPELEALNSRISQQLSSSNRLMNTVVASQLRTKGKQIRPMVVMLCARIFGPTSPNVIAAAAAVELLHNASLIHDDVVDNSSLRRGEPTINYLWNNHIAVLVGDFFTSSAMQQAILTGDIRVIDALCRLGKQLSLGEIDQIFNAQHHTLTEEGYFDIIGKKTASLFVSCARMACYTMGASEEHTEALANFAHLLGLCFQLRDDVFDYYAADTVGKPTGNDLREGKMTLPLLKVLQDPDLPDRKHALELIEKPMLDDDEIAWLQKLARDNGGVDYAFEAMRRLRDQAAVELGKVPQCEATRMLSDLLNFIIARDF